jgi:glycosyltransferase involved in cell wall biosynthesis
VMPSVVHVVVTAKLAGVERYVCNTSIELAERGWDVSVVGGDPARMPAVLGRRIRWLPGATPIGAVGALAKLGKHDICHVHMTVAEAVGIACWPAHRAPVISTRHFAASRGSTRVARAVAPVISASLARELAVSNFVASRMEHHPDAVVISGVPPSACLWKPSNRVALVLQRLDPEKDTLTALRVWQASRLWDEGWRMRVVGEGSERRMLEAWAESNDLENVEFVDWTADVSSEFESAGFLLAAAPTEPLGLAVLEAMAAGVPVLACAGGGHLETVGLLSGVSMFAPGDVEEGAAASRGFLSVEARSKASASGRQMAQTRFSIENQVDSLVHEYAAARDEASSGRAGPSAAIASIGRRRPGFASKTSPDGTLSELVVCSLEAWDDVWRRNQFFVDILLRRNPDLRVLFVDPPADPLFDLISRRRPATPRMRTISADGRLRAFRPVKILPRRVGPLADVALREQVLSVSRLLRLSRPILWVNDITYAPLMGSTGWPSLYDITDDWLLAPFDRREVDRLRDLDAFAMENADEVVVCSQALVDSRGARRTVSLIPNAVDVAHFQRPRERPKDLPERPVAVYVGSLHDARIDVDLVAEVARANPQVAVVLVGPDSLDERSRTILTAENNVLLLGPRPYEEVPAYLQHSDVVIIPHRVSPFTESLDPIKLYECLAVGKPTVATRVAGFRDHGGCIKSVEREIFAARVADVLSSPPKPVRNVEPSGWVERAADFERVMLRASAPKPVAELRR